MNEHRQIRINQLLDTDPRKVRYHEVLSDLADAPDERIKKAYSMVSLANLRTLKHYLEDAIENHKQNQIDMFIEVISKEKDITIEDVVSYALNPSQYIKENFKHL